MFWFPGLIMMITVKQVSQPLQLLKFVKYFHRVLHAELKDPVLIWYDSITKDGELIWQNALNERNRYLKPGFTLELLQSLRSIDRKDSVDSPVLQEVFREKIFMLWPKKVSEVNQPGKGTFFGQNDVC